MSRTHNFQKSSIPKESLLYHHSFVVCCALVFTCPFSDSHVYKYHILSDRNIVFVKMCLNLEEFSIITRLFTTQLIHFDSRRRFNRHRRPSSGTVSSLLARWRCEQTVPRVT